MTASWLFTGHLPPWGDEEHYLQTVRLFASGISVELLRTYEEMTTPLTFVVYSLWGQAVGLQTDRLRLLSVVLAALTCGLLANS